MQRGRGGGGGRGRRKASPRQPARPGVCSTHTSTHTSGSHNSQRCVMCCSGRLATPGSTAEVLCRPGGAAACLTQHLPNLSGHGIPLTPHKTNVPCRTPFGECRQEQALLLPPHRQGRGKTRRPPQCSTPPKLKSLLTRGLGSAGLAHGRLGAGLTGRGGVLGPGLWVRITGFRDTGPPHTNSALRLGRGTTFHAARPPIQPAKGIPPTNKDQALLFSAPHNPEPWYRDLPQVHSSLGHCLP